jgi:hypothetical protein
MLSVRLPSANTRTVQRVASRMDIAYQSSDRVRKSCEAILISGAAAQKFKNGVCVEAATFGGVAY